MARRNTDDELLMEDELSAAFLGDDLAVEGMEQIEETPEGLLLVACHPLGGPVAQNLLDQIVRFLIHRPSYRSI